MKQKIVYVEWDDSAMIYGWQGSADIQDAIKIAKCCTVGFLVGEDKNVLALSLNASVDGRTCPFGEIVSIPKCAITKRRKIEA